jgi:hypothetical protein
MIAARGLRGEANRDRREGAMAAAFDHSFAETLQPARRAVFPMGARSGGDDRLAKA